MRVFLRLELGALHRLCPLYHSCTKCIFLSIWLFWRLCKLTKHRKQTSVHTRVHNVNRRAHV